MKKNRSKLFATLFASTALVLPLAAYERSSGDRNDRQATHRGVSSERQGDRGTGNREAMRVADRLDRSHIIGSDDLLGMDVRSADDEDVGTVHDVFLDLSSGRILAVSVTAGGFLGIGGQRRLLSPRDLDLDSDKEKLKADLSKEEIRSAPRLRQGDEGGLDRVQPVNERQGGSTQLDRATRTQPPAGNARPAQNQGRHGDRRNDISTRLAASDITGMTVRNHEGSSIGSVDEIYFDLRNHRVIGVVVSSGGFLGMGGQQNILALNEFSYDAEEEELRVRLSRDDLRRAPVYDRDDDGLWENLRERWENFAEEAGERWDTFTDSAAETARDTRDSARESVDRDRLTAFDQGNSREDRELTASIRRAIREHDDLSARARNVTVISRDGRVLLRGEVDSSREKSAVESIAHEKAGRRNVTSDLTVRNR
jgi:sporulation protein YlmC with PRC-barrel domain